MHCITKHSTSPKMKLFLTLFALFAVSSAGPISDLTAQQQLESIADFYEKVKEIYKALVAKGSDFVCSVKLQELLDILGFPEALDGAVELAQQWVCGNEEALMSSPQLYQEALGGFMDKVKEIYEKAKNYGKDLVCGSSLQELLDLFGVDDRLDSAVALVQKWICGEPEPAPEVVKRSADIDFMLEESFVDVIKRIYNQLKEKSADFVCSAKLNELLDLLGLDERLAPAVKFVQDKLCPESDILESNSPVEALEAYAIVWSEIWEKIKAYGYERLCTTKLQDLLDILGVPDAFDGAVEMAQKKICGLVSNSKREVALSPEVKLRLSGALAETAREYAATLLKKYMKFIICSSRLQQLMDWLGVPDDMDGAVEMAQEMICGSGILGSALAVQEKYLQGYLDTILTVLKHLAALGKEYVCNADLPEVIASLGLPDIMVSVVRTAVSFFC